MTEREQEIWDTLHRHLKSVFERNAEAYEMTTAEDLSLFEWWVTGYATRLRLQCATHTC
jgi:hypothetical protein